MKWQRIEDAITASGGFETGSYLKKFSREKEGAYAERKKSAIYENDILRNIKRFIGLLFRVKPIRESSSSKLAGFWQNGAVGGGGIGGLITSIAIDIKCKGMSFVLVDRDERGLVMCQQVKPEKIKELVLDRYGEIEKGVFWDSIEGKKCTREVTKTNTKIVFEGARPDVEIAHSLGKNPLLMIKEGVSGGLGSYAIIAELSEKKMNLESELRLIEVGQTFGVLTYQVGELADKRADIDIGTDNVLYYEGARPDFIAVDGSSHAAYLASIEAVNQSIKDVAGFSKGGANDSAEAVKAKFDEINAELSEFAAALSDLEYRIVSIYNKFTGASEVATISYPSDFNLMDEANEIEAILSAVEAGMPAEYINSKKMRLAVSQGLSDDEMEKVRQELNYTP